MSQRPGSSNTLRIIGGQWRSRRLKFAAVPGLRPTPDRIRETLFNWLQPCIHGARCLDLFAGSGALGLEALSRGAGEVMLVEKHPVAARTLRDNLAVLDAQHAVVINTDALHYLAQAAVPFDVIFLDPPFRQGILAKALEMLLARDLLKPGGLVYVEQEMQASGLPVHPGLAIYRETCAGQVQSRLLVQHVKPVTVLDAAAACQR